MGKADTSLAEELNTFYARFEAAAHGANNASTTNRAGRAIVNQEWKALSPLWIMTRGGLSRE